MEDIEIRILSLASHRATESVSLGRPHPQRWERWVRACRGEAVGAMLTEAVTQGRDDVHRRTKQKQSVTIRYRDGGDMDLGNKLPTDAANDALEWAAMQPGWWHDSGNLDIRVLKAIVKHARRIDARESAETGCGLSTVVLSAVATRHTCFTIAAGNSLEQVQNVPHLRHDRVNFVIGPSQLTLPRHTFFHPLDLVLIDGPHGFPFAHMEYFHFYQRIRKGGILVVDDIHIPTVRQMYDVLRDDRMWTHVEDVLTTAFFVRTQSPLFDPFGDGWERQQFNQRHFADSSAMDEYSPGWRDAMPASPGDLLGSGSAVWQARSESTTSVLDNAQAEIEHLRRENASLKASTSWRVTAPLRAIATKLNFRSPR